MKRLASIISLAILAAANQAMAQERLIEGIDLARACAKDVERLCAGVIPGGGRIKACVKEKMGQLSPPCFDTLLKTLAGHMEQPDYAAKSAVKRFDNLRGMQYCEVFLISVDPANDSLAADFFNTTDLNNSDPRDTCPPAMWAKVNPDALKEEHKVLGVFKNGPRGWVMDWIELPAGEVQTFDGLQARWMGHVELPKGVELGKKGSTAYKPTQVHRKSTMTFNKGNLVFILDDPEGTPWVMQASSKIVDPNLTYEQLSGLATKLKPPTGWKFRVAKLDQDLTIKAVDGVAHIVQDELENTYDQCFATACTFNP